MVPRKIEIVCPKCNYKTGPFQQIWEIRQSDVLFVADIFTILGELEK